MITIENYAKSISAPYPFKDRIYVERIILNAIEFAQTWIPIEKEDVPMHETILVKMEGLIVGIGVFSKEISIINGQYADSMPKVTHWRPINYI